MKALNKSLLVIACLILIRVISIPTKEVKSIQGFTIPVYTCKCIDVSIKKELLITLNMCGILHPEIVYAQAVLETGHFKSSVLENYNNLFGLYNSSIKDYYSFNTWEESILAYVRYIQYKCKEDEDYYAFLNRIGYAEDPEYVNKLKVIVAQIN